MKLSSELRKFLAVHSLENISLCFTLKTNKQTKLLHLADPVAGWQPWFVVLATTLGRENASLP